MRKGEKGIIVAMVIGVIIMVGVKMKNASNDVGEDPGIPFFSTASPEITSHAAKVMHQNECKLCHSLWGTKDFFQSVPSPDLDGEGMFRTEQWLFEYFSATDPQTILPSRLKKEYRHPSLADLPEEDRRALASYMASLRVEDWYLAETTSRRYEKLTGKKYQPNEQTP